MSPSDNFFCTHATPALLMQTSSLPYLLRTIWNISMMSDSWRRSQRTGHTSPDAPDFFASSLIACVKQYLYISKVWYVVYTKFFYAARDKFHPELFQLLHWANAAYTSCQWGRVKSIAWNEVFNCRAAESINFHPDCLRLLDEDLNDGLTCRYTVAVVFTFMWL